MKSDQYENSSRSSKSLMRLCVEGRLVLVTRLPTVDLPVSVLNDSHTSVARILTENLLASSNLFRPESGNVEDFELRKNRLGKPQILLSGGPGPSVSFSRCKGIAWAAMCEDAAAVGIDIAHPSEFPHDYAFHQAFHEAELESAITSDHLTKAEAAARLWSAKEATVKALGCGFHLMAPLDLSVFFSRREDDSGRFTVEFSQRILKRFPSLQVTELMAVSLLHGECWLSLALIPIRFQRAKKIPSNPICVNLRDEIT